MNRCLRQVVELQNRLSEESKKADKMEFEYKRVKEKVESLQKEKDVRKGKGGRGEDGMEELGGGGRRKKWIHCRRTNGGSGVGDVRVGGQGRRGGKEEVRDVE